MSLINQMLQDLDARGVRPARNPDTDLTPVYQSRRAVYVWLVLALAVAVLAIAVLTWRVVRERESMALSVPAAVMPVPALTSVPTSTPILTPVLASVLASVPTVPAPTPTPTPVLASVSTLPPAAVPVAPSLQARSAAAQPAAQRMPTPIAIESAPASRIESGRSVGVKRESGAVPAALDDVKKQQPSARQAAENAYRRALGMLQEGRISAAIEVLEQALRSDPGHDAARQTLVGLLLEGKRTDEAMQQLQQALNLDPGQPVLAMALARLQVEQHGPALQTLMRSMPYALENADYQGFVAAVLQRERRHQDAIAHYQAALRLNPQNGIWWMGLGISLEAQQRQDDARAAFQRAKMSGSLTGELPAFVDKKLLAR